MPYVCGCMCVVVNSTVEMFTFSMLTSSSGILESQLHQMIFCYLSWAFHLSVPSELLEFCWNRIWKFKQRSIQSSATNDACLLDEDAVIIAYCQDTHFGSRKRDSGHRLQSVYPGPSTRIMKILWLVGRRKRQQHARSIRVVCCGLQ